MITTLGSVTAALLFMLGAVVSIGDPQAGQAMLVAAVILGVLAALARH